MSLEMHPKSFGRIPGATIPFISLRHPDSKLPNFAILLAFLTLKACQKISFIKQADCSLTTGFSGLKNSRDFRETGPRSDVFRTFDPVTFAQPA